MFDSIVYFFHHLVNPHCEHCREEKEEAKVCQSCEGLKYQIESLTYHNGKLLEALLNSVSRPETVQTAPDFSNLKPISPKSVPWNVRRQQLEAESLKKAKELQEQESQSEHRVRVNNEPLAVKVPVEELERNLGVSENAS